MEIFHSKLLHIRFFSLPFHSNLHQLIDLKKFNLQKTSLPCEPMRDYVVLGVLMMLTNEMCRYIICVSDGAETQLRWFTCQMIQ